MENCHSQRPAGTTGMVLPKRKQAVEDQTKEQCYDTRTFIEKACKSSTILIILLSLVLMNHTVGFFLLLFFLTDTTTWHFPFFLKGLNWYCFLKDHSNYFDDFFLFTLQGEAGSPGMLGQKVSGHIVLGNCNKCCHMLNKWL